MPPRDEAYEPAHLQTLGDLRKFLEQVKDFPDETSLTGSYEGRVDVEVWINGGWPPNTNPSVWVHVEEDDPSLTE